MTAVEIDPGFASRARTSLADGGTIDTGMRDAILVNAGVTHPTEKWLDNIAVGGTLILPITIEVGMPHIGKGLVRFFRSAG
jgi:protein-L-isoaspartate(D-aspartate) O-methyltransferase